MTVNYRAVKRVDPLNKNKQDKYYPMVVQQGVTDLNTLAITLSKKTKLEHEFVQNVLEDFVKVVTKKLSEGESISLGDIGSFTIDTKVDLNSGEVNEQKIRFRTGKGLQKKLGNLEFKKV